MAGRLHDCVTFLEPGLHLTPLAGFLTLQEIKQRLLRGSAGLCLQPPAEGPGPGVPEAFTDRSPENSLLLHSSQPHVRLLLLPPSFRGSELNAALPLQRLSPHIFFPGIRRIPLSFFALLRCSVFPSRPRTVPVTQLPRSDLINHIQRAQCCSLGSPRLSLSLSLSNCLLFSLPVSRREHFSLSKNKTQILMQRVRFLFYSCI